MRKWSFWKWSHATSSVVWGTFLNGVSSWKLLTTQDSDSDGHVEPFYFHLKNRKASENPCHKQTIQGLCDNHPHHSTRPETNRDHHWQRPETLWQMKIHRGSEKPTALPLMAKLTSWQIVPSSETNAAWRAAGSEGTLWGRRRIGRTREGLGSQHATSFCSVRCCYMSWKALEKIHRTVEFVSLQPVLGCVL